MRPRHSLLEVFSTFLQFDADRPAHWAIEAQLRRSMQRCLDQETGQREATAKDFWALYWHKRWQADALTTPQSLPTAHLSAYLQEACYWAAQRNKTTFSTAQFTLADCFQVAIVQVSKILRGFNSQQGFSLETYAGAVFSGAIRETLRQQQQVDVCTDWGLLRKISQKRLVEALQAAGISESTIAQSVLAWSCFKTLYVPTQVAANRKLPKPEPETWHAIASLYNQERLTANISTNATAAQIEQWLSRSAQAVRSYLNPTLISINTPKAGQDSGEWLDDVTESKDSLLTELIAQEEDQNRKSQQTELNTVLTTAIAHLDETARSLLQLYYGQQLTQQQMAQQLDIKQYTVSRRLSRAREQLLTALAKWSKDVLHIPVTTDLLSYTNTALEEWLQRHYHLSHSSDSTDLME